MCDIGFMTTGRHTHPFLLLCLSALRPSLTLPRSSLSLVTAFLVTGAPSAIAQLPAAVLTARAQAQSEDLETRERGMSALASGPPEGAAVLRRILTRRLKQADQWAAGFGRSAAGKKLRRRARAQLEEARKTALTKIFDEQNYYKRDGVHGHAEVDEAVSVVRELYHRPVQRLRREFPAIDRFLADLALDLAFATRIGGVDGATPMPVILDRLDKSADVAALDRTNASDRWEDRVREAIESCEQEASPGEVEVVLLLNDYRRMMGRGPLAPHIQLMRAARKHSQEMETLGYFSHTSPTPARRSPTLRAKLEGYGGSCAENIARAGSASGAHEGWYGSPGHHRNMLGRHRVVGIGCSKGGGYWTQMLGRNTPPRSKGARTVALAVYLTRVTAIPERDHTSRRSLAVWCKRRGLYRAMEQEAKWILAKRPDDAETRALLDETREGDGPWQHPVERAAAAAPDNEAGIQILSKFQGHDDPYHRIRATRALARLFVPAAEVAVAKALKDGNPEVRAEAAFGLMAGSRPQTDSLLKAATRDKSPIASHAATAALYRRGNADGVARLFAAGAAGDDLSRASVQITLRFIAHQDFGYRWDGSTEQRAEALKRAQAWFQRQRDE